jgi:HK97 family phage prohead protease
MTKKEDEIVQREVGEQVSFGAHFESEKTKDLGEGVIEATISTNAVDHHGEIINMDGVDTSAYHGTVLYGHDYEGLPIGKTISLKKFKNKITARFQLAVKEYPFAQTIYDMIKGGYLTDVSIGGFVAKWSEDYRTIEEMIMKEFSVVPIGANREAMITSKALDTIGKSTEVVKTEYHDFARKVLLDKVSNLGEDEVKQSIGVLRNLIATLEESAKADSTVREGEAPEVRRIKHITLRDSAKAVATQSQRVITVIKIKAKE